MLNTETYRDYILDDVVSKCCGAEILVSDVCTCCEKESEAVPEEVVYGVTEWRDYI